MSWCYAEHGKIIKQRWGWSDKYNLSRTDSRGLCTILHDNSAEEDEWRTSQASRWNGGSGWILGQSHKSHQGCPIEHDFNIWAQSSSRFKYKYTNYTNLNSHIYSK